MSNYRIWVNKNRTVLVRLWVERRALEVARRESPAHTWGPPEYLTEESVEPYESFAASQGAFIDGPHPADSVEGQR